METFVFCLAAIAGVAVAVLLCSPEFWYLVRSALRKRKYGEDGDFLLWVCDQYGLPDIAKRFKQGESYETLYPEAKERAERTR